MLQVSECRPSLSPFHGRCMRKRTQSYTRNLIDEALRLQGISSRWMLTKILENEEDKNTIEESFKHIDEYTKDFHVRDSCIPDLVK